MEQQENLTTEAKKETAYTVKIIPDDGEEVTTFRLSGGMLRYAMTCLWFWALLFVGVCTFAAYGGFNIISESEAVTEFRRVRVMQQEQLQQLVKKTEAIRQELDELERTENELRVLIYGQNALQSTPAQNTAAEEKKDKGQGGQYQRPDAKKLSEALDELEQQAVKRRESVAQLRKALKEKEEEDAYRELLASGRPMGWPADGEISSPFGLRWGGSDFHPGLDIADDFGTPIYATAHGTVIYAGWNDGGYGNMVEIEHPNGMVTLYAHSEQVVVRVGQEVKRGELIAYMGSTGFSTGPHVHYEISIDGERVDPSNFL